jgi:transcriptional regulator with XRE-family HTH domain
VDEDRSFLTPAANSAAALLVLARQRSRLSRAQLAELALVSASVIVGIEEGTRSPALAELETIVRAAGFDIGMRLQPHDDHDEVLATLELAATPAERARHRADEARRLADLYDSLAAEQREAATLYAELVPTIDRRA